MPFAVTHVLFPIILLDIIKKHAKQLKPITLHVILVGGFFGLLPDVDVVLEIVYFWLFGNVWGVHRALHTACLCL